MNSEEINNPPEIYEAIRGFLKDHVARKIDQAQQKIAEKGVKEVKRF